MYVLGARVVEWDANVTVIAECVRELAINRLSMTNPCEPSLCACIENMAASHMNAESAIFQNNSTDATNATQFGTHKKKSYTENAPMPNQFSNEFFFLKYSGFGFAARFQIDFG